jgi:hypothetical protein
LPFIRGQIGKDVLIEEFFEKIYENNDKNQQKKEATKHFYDDLFFPLLAEEFYQS